MRKLYFLGLASKIRGAWRHIFARGKEADIANIEKYLGQRYGGEAWAVKNGRTGLALALRAYFDKGDKVVVNGFTCHAVVEAVRAAGLTPVFADIDENLNFNARTLARVADDGCVGIIVQNTMGNPVDIKAVERFAEKHGMLIVEDLAHSVGVRYADGREVGTVGVATALSFGKDKSVDTVSGGAVIFRETKRNRVTKPVAAPGRCETWQARWYPMFAAWSRGLTRIHLGGALVRIFVKIRFVERSADNGLDMKCRIAPYQAKLALPQLVALEKPQGLLREYMFVRDRAAALAELKAAGYYFDALWYEKPVSPARYYDSVNFPEERCKCAVKIAEMIVNLPTYYPKAELARAREILRKYKVEEVR